MWIDVKRLVSWEDAAVPIELCTQRQRRVHTVHPLIRMVTYGQVLQIHVLGIIHKETEKIQQKKRKLEIIGKLILPKHLQKQISSSYFIPDSHRCIIIMQ